MSSNVYIWAWSKSPNTPPGLASTSTPISWPGGVSRVPLDLATVDECAVGLVRSMDVHGSPSCSLCPAGKLEFEHTRCIDKVGRIGLLMPITNAPTGQLLNQNFLSLTCAVKLAVRHINERVDAVVPGLGAMTQNLTRLDATLYDSGFSNSLAVSSFLQMQTGDGVNAVVGPARSAPSLTTAFIGKTYKMPQCSYWASSPLLSNKVLYPYFGRSYPSDELLTKKVPSAMYELGWRKASLLFDPDEPWSASFAEGLQVDSLTFSVRILTAARFTSGASSSYASAVQLLKDSGTNIFVCAAMDADLLAILQIAQQQGILGKGYVWLGAATLEGSLQYATDPVAAMQLLEGMFTFQASPLGTAGYSRYTASLNAQAMSECANDMFNVSDYPTIYSREPHAVGAFAYDCVVSLAVAMARASDPDDGDEVFNAFKQLTFDGASGSIAFDPNTADRADTSATYGLMNWQLLPGGNAEDTEGPTSPLRVVERHVLTISFPGELRTTLYDIVWPGGARGIQNKTVDVTTMPLQCDFGDVANILPGGVQACRGDTDGIQTHVAISLAT